MVKLNFGQIRAAINGVVVIIEPKRALLRRRASKLKAKAAIAELNLSYSHE